MMLPTLPCAHRRRRGSYFPRLCANKEQKPAIFLAIVPNLPRARLATVVEKLDISLGSVLNRTGLQVVSLAVLDPTAINVYLKEVNELMVGGKIGHIARNCPMNNEGGNFGGYGGGGYDNSGKTCYACGGFGIAFSFHFTDRLGHMAKDCTQGQKCYNCGRLGHVSRDCDQAAQAKVCYRCQQPGHISRDCPNEAAETN